MIELEKTYLARKLPNDLKNSKFKEIIDAYIPKQSKHPTLRLRKNGAKFELTKKEPINEGDSSEQNEQTIILTEAEFEALNSQVDGKRVRKLRYFYEYKGRIAEVDVFQDALLGLVLVDFEFESSQNKNSFEMPDFCLADVTQEDFIAGGMICGKSYEEIKDKLDSYNYTKLYLD